MKKKCLIISFIAVILGAIIINIYPKDFIIDYSLLNIRELERIIKNNSGFESMLRAVIVSKAKYWMLLVILFITVLRRKAAFIICAYGGASFGVFVSYCIAVFGINGLRIAFGMILPQMIFYIMSLVIFYIKVGKNITKPGIGRIGFLLVSAFIWLIGNCFEALVYMCFLAPVIG